MVWALAVIRGKQLLYISCRKLVRFITLLSHRSPPPFPFAVAAQGPASMRSETAFSFERSGESVTLAVGLGLCQVMLEGDAQELVL